MHGIGGRETDGDEDGDERLDGNKRERGRGQRLRGRITDNQITHTIMNVFFNTFYEF